MPDTGDRSKRLSPRADRRRALDVRRSRLLLAGSVAVAALILAAWFPASALYRQHTSLAGATQELHQLHQQDSALAQEKKNLSDAAEIARIAREQYQLVNPGQQAYEVLPPSSDATPGAPYAGDPGLSSPADPSAATELPPATSSASTAHSTGLQPGGHQTAGSPGTFERMLHALEFWR